MTPLWLIALIRVAAADEIITWDLSAEDGGFASYGDTDAWAWGTIVTGPLGGASGSSAWTTGLEGIYANESTDYLQLPSVDLSSAARPVLLFSHWYEIDTSDAGWVEVWNGSAWETLDPIYGYPAESGFTGSSNGWRDAWFDLTGLQDGSYVRLVFATDERVALAGWFVDDVALLDGDPVPPWAEIVRQPEDTQDLEGPYLVEAWVQDDQADPEVTLYWTAGQAEPVPVEMSELIPGLFRGEISGAAPDTTVRWWVVASDGTNTTTLPDADGDSFRVYLAAPTDLAGPGGRVVGHTVDLSWTPPDTPHQVVGYALYRDGDLLDTVSSTTATAALTASAHQFAVSALYEEGEGDLSSPLDLSVALPEVTELSPRAAWQGDTVRVSARGRYLLLTAQDASLDLGDGIVVEEVEVIDADHAVFTLCVADDAATGSREGTLTSGDLEIALPEPFEVLSGEDRPTLVSIEPDALVQGEVRTVVIEASAELADPPLVDLGEGLYVEVLSVEGSTVTLSVAVDWEAPVGARGITVDDGARVLDGVSLLVRTATTTPERTCGTAQARPSLLGVVLALLGVGLSRRGPGRRRRRP